MINCFVFKPPAPYCLMYQDRSNCSQSFSENQTSLQMRSFIVLWNWYQTEELCIVWFQSSIFWPSIQYQPLLYMWLTQICHTLTAFLSYGSYFSFCLLIFKIHLFVLLKQNFSLEFFFGQLATKLITARVSSDGGVNKESPLLWGKAYLTSICVNAASACASLFIPADEVFTCLKMHKST